MTEYCVIKQRLHNKRALYNTNLCDYYIESIRNVHNEYFHINQAYEISFIISRLTKCIKITVRSKKLTFTDVSVCVGEYNLGSFRTSCIIEIENNT